MMLRTASKRTQPDDEQEAAAIEALAVAAAEGNAEAMSALYERYIDATYRVVYVQLRDHNATEDVVGDVWMKVCRSIRSYESTDAGFCAWLKAIVRNTLKDKYRSVGRQRELPTADMFAIEGEVMGQLTAAHTAEDAAIARETVLEVEEALRKLPKSQAAAVTHRFFYGLSVVETASAMGISSANVKQLQHRAMKRLAKLLPDPRAFVIPAGSSRGDFGCPTDERGSTTIKSRPFSTGQPRLRERGSGSETPRMP